MAAAAVAVLAPVLAPQVVMATALHYQVAVIPLFLVIQAKVITAAAPATPAMVAVALLFGVAAVAVVAQVAPPLNMLAAIA